MWTRRGREDPEGPVFVPAAFEAEYLEEARREVAASHGGSVRAAQDRPPGSPQRARTLRTMLGVGLVVLVVLVIAGVTNTGTVGVTVLLIVAISLGVGRYVLGTFPPPGGDADTLAGTDDRDRR
jgi:uncharacterized integral membrane protein